MRLAAKVSRGERKFLGFCERIDEYAQAIDDDAEVFGFTSGEFSLIDVIDAAVRRVSGARMVVATWTAAQAEMDHVFAFLDAGMVSGSRWIVDRSFQNRQPKLCEHLRQLYGDDAIRVQRVHCKFVLLQGSEKSALIQTSANLNRNKRIENISITTCPVLIDAYGDLVKEIFGTQMPSAGFEADANVTQSFHAVAGHKRRPKTITAPWHR